MPTWPGSLPQDFFVGITDTRRPAFEQFTVDAGPAMRRRTFGGASRDIPAPLILSQAQRVVFDTFYQTTLEEGTLEFDFIDPVSGLTASYRFAEPPTFSQIPTAQGFYYRGQMVLERLP